MIVWVLQSLEAMLEALREEGYDLGPDLGPDGARIDGEAIISALQKQEDQRAVLKGVNGIREMCDHTHEATYILNYL